MSAVNSYLLIVPFVNYSIFDYYDAYLTQIRIVFTSNQIEGSLEEFLAPFSSFWARGLTLVGYSVGLSLAFIALRWGKKSRTTSWLQESGRHRPIAYYFYLAFFGIQMAVVFNWLLRHILIWTLLNRQLTANSLHPFHSDQMFGLGFLGDLTWYSFVVVFFISLLVAIWLAGARLTFRQDLFDHPGHLAGLIVLVGFAPLAVILPLNAAHSLMAEAKMKSLGKLSTVSASLSRELERAAFDDPTQTDDLDKLTALVAAHDQVYQRVASTSTWPVSGIAYTSALILGFFNPIIIAFIVESGRHLMVKRKK